ncbi:MAG: hypothetical protein AMXMBFR84_12360 [Candidatus Hydrogenedentota bacterium]
MGVDDSKEKMRLCPTCRMEISVLATKCRFCGENVGRPRDEVRALSIDDLGGETIRHYAPSSSVMEAIEAFRSETEASNPQVDEGGRKSIFGRKGKKDAPAAPQLKDGLPDLDERSQVLASLAMPTASTPARKPVTVSRHAQTDWIRKVGYFAAMVAGIVILYFGSVQVLAIINRKPAEPPRQFSNPAEALLQRGGDSLQALEGAVMAQNREKHSKNEEILQNARQSVVAEIESLLNASKWTLADLRKASELANKAFDHDKSEAIAALKQEADREWFAYSMVLVEAGNDVATFKINKPNAAFTDVTEKTSLEVKKGDVILDRFEVSSIRANAVTVMDKMRKGRLLIFAKDKEVAGTGG